MKNNLFFLICLPIILYSCNSNNTIKDQADYNNTLYNIHTYERSNPVIFLSSDGKYKESFWGDEFSVNCEVVNSSKLTDFKDIVLNIIYYSNTNSVIGTENYTIYDTFRANSKKTVTLSIKNYKNVASLGWEVLDAKGNYDTFY